MPDIWCDVDAALAEVPVNIFPLTDDTDFKAREVSIAYDAAGMDLVWNFVTTAGAYTQTAVTPTTGGNYDWAHQGDGMYSIEIPASGGASINNDTEGFGWFSGVATGVLPWRGPILGFRAAAINNALVDGTTIDVNVTAISGDSTAADNLEAATDGNTYNVGGGAVVAASVTGAVGSVTGAVGSVTGAVGSVAANGITATSIAADALNAAAIKTDAVTKVQNGLATPTNITAGTITTVTNLTNAPTNGDLTATMKTSVQTAATAATPTAAAVTGAVGSVTGAVGSVTGNVGGNVVGSVASVTGAVGSVTGNVGGNVAGNVAGSVGSVTGAVGSVTGAVGSVTGNVGGNVVGSVASVTAKTGYVLAATGLDAITATTPTGVATTFPQKMVQVWHRFFGKATMTATQIKTYDDAGTGTLTTQTVSDDGTTQTQGAAT